MIRRVKGGYAVFSETTGRKLSRVYKSRDDAVERLRQIEWFKHHPEKSAGRAKHRKGKR